MTKSPDPSNTLNPDSPRSATKQLHRRAQSQLRFGTDAHRVKRRRQALDSDASVERKYMNPTALEAYASLQFPPDELHGPDCNYQKKKKRGETAKGRE
jgi:hypothetical protein